MKTLVKSASVFEFQKPLSLKKDLLFFDKIAFDEFTFNSYKTNKNEIIQFNMREIEYLIKAELLELMNYGFVQNPIDTIAKPERIDNGILTLRELTPKFAELTSELGRLIELSKKSNNVNLKNKILELVEEGTRLKARSFACILNVEKHDDYYTIFSSNPVLLTDKKQNVLKFLFSQIPMPDENLPWEAIIDYKSDKEVQRKYYALIDWANQVANSTMTMSEIEDRYRALLSDYVAQLNLHKLKTQKTSFKTVVIAGAEILENLARLKFSEVAKSLFSINQGKLDLMEAETKITGRELAYIYDVNEKLGKK